MKADQAVRQTLQVCRRGFAAPDLPAAVVHLIGEAVPFDIACWGLLDPVTQLPTTNSSTTQALESMHRIWEYELLIPDVVTLGDLLRGRPSVGALSAATADEPSASARYRDVLQPYLGVTDELRAALVVDGIGWGWLSLLRTDGVTFRAPDISRIAALVPALATTLRSAALLAGTADDSNRIAPGVLIVDADGRLDSATATGRMLLDLIPSVAGLPLPVVVRSLALTAHARLWHSGEHQPDGAPSGDGRATVRARVPGRDGIWLYLEAEALSGSGGRTAITVQPAGRAEMSPVALRAYGLTARESDVTLCVLRGESTREIAAALHLSPWTVQDHLKAVFAKVGVRSRRDLTMQLFTPPGHGSRPR